MPAVIFSGDTVKALKSAIQLSDNSTITSGSVDPSSIATAGVAGDVYISTSTKLIYVKQDSGSSTNWTKPIFSDGTNFNYNTGTHTLTVANLTVNGATTSIETTNVNVSDKLVILNKNGAVSSGGNVGFEVEENAIITGYVQTSSDRNSWNLKAPGTAGVATITPGTGGINFTGTGNGASISGNLEIDNSLNSNVALIVKGVQGSAPANLLFDAEYNNGSSLDATFVSSGSATPTSTSGSPTVSGGKLHLTAGATQLVNYPGTAVASAVNKGTIRFKFTPNYTGPPATETDLVAIRNNVSAFPAPNDIVIYSTGNLHADIRDSGGTVVAQPFFAYSPTAGVEDEIELDWDLDAGATRLFLNGVQMAFDNGTGTRDSTVTDFVVGFFNSGDISNGSFRDIVVYDNVQHITNFSSPIAALGGPFTPIQTADLQDWVDSSGDITSFVDSAGFITLPGDPTTALMAATKQYVDAETLSKVLTNGNNAGAIAITNLSTLKDGSNVNAIDIPNRLLYDQAGLVSEDFNGRILYDTANGESVLWQNRILYDASTITSVDWANRTLFDAGNFTSIDWANHNLHDTTGVPSVDYTARTLIASDGSTVKFDWSGSDLSANTHKITNVVNPTSAQDSATKNYVDNRIQVFTSNASVGGAATEVLTVTGLLATDTILSVSQKTGGAGVLPMLGFTTHANNTLSVYWSADPGPGAVVIVGVIR